MGCLNKKDIWGKSDDFGLESHNKFIVGKSRMRTDIM